MNRPPAVPMLEGVDNEALLMSLLSCDANASPPLTSSYEIVSSSMSPQPQSLCQNIQETNSFCPDIALLSNSDLEILNQVQDTSSNFSDLLMSGTLEMTDLPSIQRSLSSPSASSTSSAMIKELSSDEGSGLVNLCQVCYAPADKHVHYGAQVCGSCRGFFRRTVTNNTSDTFICKKDQNCVIDSKVTVLQTSIIHVCILYESIRLQSRKSCAWCRYQKCLSAGMNPKWMMTTQERKQSLEKRKRKVLEEKRKRITSVSRPIHLVISREELLYIEQIAARSHAIFIQAMTSLFRKDPTPLVTIR